MVLWSCLGSLLASVLLTGREGNWGGTLSFPEPNGTETQHFADEHGGTFDKGGFESWCRARKINGVTVGL